MEKFKVGQKVYCIIRGLGVVAQDDYNTVLPILVRFSSGTSLYKKTGKGSESHTNPTLLTLEEARAKGYDVPKQKIVKEKTVYINLYETDQFAHDNEESAKASRGSGTGYCGKILATAYPVTIKYEVEE